MRFSAIIQARMTSTRLPGKVLMKVFKKPLLWYQVERIRNCRNIDEIIIATTTNNEDDLIVGFAENVGLRFYRGSEHDVLDRYYQCAKDINADHILRLTGDCPLIDPAICDRMIENYRTASVNIAHTGPTFAEGLDCEVFSFWSLKTAWQNAELVSEREHCTLYIHNHPEIFKKFTLENDTDDSKFRFTVDQYEDFLVVKAIIENLFPVRSINFSFSDIKRFLDLNPEIFRINSSIIRNEGLKK